LYNNFNSYNEHTFKCLWSYFMSTFYLFCFSIVLNALAYNYLIICPFTKLTWCFFPDMYVRPFFFFRRVYCFNNFFNHNYCNDRHILYYISINLLRYSIIFSPDICCLCLFKVVTYAFSSGTPLNEFATLSLTSGHNQNNSHWVSNSSQYFKCKKKNHHLKSYPTQNFDPCRVDIYQMFLHWICSKINNNNDNNNINSSKQTLCDQKSNSGYVYHRV